VELEEVQARMALGERVVPPNDSRVSVCVSIWDINSSKKFWFEGTVEGSHVDNGLMYLRLAGWYRNAWCLSLGTDQIRLSKLPDNCPPYETWERY